MAKLVLSMFISLDGYVEGPNGAFIPPAWSDDLERHWSGYALERAGHLLYGRTNFVFNRDFWSVAETDPEGPAAAIPHARRMNALPKTVFSTTMTGDPGWNGTLVRDDMAGAVGKLKAEASGDLYSFGGAGLADSLMRLDLVDEYRLMITPNLFGGGRRLFDDGRPRVDLALVDAQPLDTGAVILRYQRNQPG